MKTGAQSTKQETRFPNWQSRIFLSAISRRQPILAADLPRPLTAFLRWYEDTIMRVDSTPAPPDRPIFLIGMPRSGTTMLQDILCSHPQVAFISNTMNLFPDCFSVIDHYRRLLRLDFEGDRYLADSVTVTASSPSDAVAMWARWFNIDVYDLAYAPRTMADFPPQRIAQIHALISRVIWSHHGRRTRFFNKLLAVTPYIHLINQIFPGARFVHIIRDPRNTANSMLKLYKTEVQHQKEMGLAHRDPLKGDQYFCSYPRFKTLPDYAQKYGLEDIRTTANLWNDEIDYIDSIRPTLPNLYEIRYEDIGKDPQGQISKLLEFCQLTPLDDTCTAIWNKIKQVGALRHSNKYDNFQLVEQICGHNMRRHGYQSA